MFLTSRNRCIVFLSTVLLLWGVESPAEKLTIGTGLQPPLVSSGAEEGFLDTLAKEVYRRIGIDLEIIILPAGRVLENANRGVEDGCLLRIEGLEKYYPNLVRIPESIFDSEFVGYTRTALPVSSDWQALAPFSVGFVTGWKIFEANVKKAREVQQVSTPGQLFKILKEDRVDIVLYERWQGLYLARQMKISGLKTVEPPFVSKKMYMYLNKKYKNLVPQVAASLAAVKEDGTFEKIFLRTLGPLRSSQ